MHYLYARVQQSGPEQEQLPGEIELCHKFGVSRGTVQRAIEGLMTNGYVTKLPKRRGIFTNPGLAGKIPYSIGIVAHAGITEIMDDLDSSALNGFFRKITARLEQPLLFHYLSVESPELLENTLKSRGIRALFWIAPDETCISVFDRIVSHGIPAVAALSPYYHSEHPFPKYNAFIRDYKAHGRHMAEFVVENGFRAPLYCGIRGTVFNTIIAELAKHGIHPDPALLIEDDLGFEKKLASILEKKKPDCILPCGGNPRYNTVVNVLQSNRKFAEIPVIVINDATATRYKLDYPELNIMFHSRYSSNDYLYKIGEHSAGTLLGLMKNPDRKIPAIRFNI